jgi:hypothetical protein
MRKPPIRRGRRPHGIPYACGISQAPKVLRLLADRLEKGRLDLSHESDDIFVRIMMPRKRRAADQVEQ